MDHVIPAFCDCGQLDLAPVVAACSPESLLVHLGDPTDAHLRKPILHVKPPLRWPFPAYASLCTLCRIINGLLREVDPTMAFDSVEIHVQIYYSSSRRTWSNHDPFLAIAFTPFPIIKSTPFTIHPPSRGPQPTPVAEYAFTHDCTRASTLRSPKSQGWEVHLECAPDQKLNWEGIKLAFSDCRRKHSSSCGRNIPRSIPGLHVIDCGTWTLVPFTEHVGTRSLEYAALSYVWGAATETPIIFSGSRLPADIPLVVADAISVCLQLGLQYLWVDRYCILQDDAETKDAQIRNMNLIYKQAELTIIAAAGSGPTYGLPGVSRQRPNVPQASMLKLGPYAIVPVLSESKIQDSYDSHMDSFAGSTWNSRGWTYQEAVVSRRRLVLTDRLVVFQCWESKWDERFSDTATTDNFHEDLLFALSIPRTVPQLLPHGPIGFDASHFGIHATEYFCRQFTYISDRLVAFQGILQEFALSPAGLRHLCAVPVYRMSSPLSTADQIKPKRGSTLWEKLKSLLYSEARLERSRGAELPADLVLAGFVPGLCWSLVARNPSGRDSLRRIEAACLPSWSWMGWRAPSRAYDVRFFQLDDFYPADYSLLVKEIRVGFGTTENETSVPNDTESALDIAVGLGRLDALYLHITAWVFEARIKELPKEHKSFGLYDRAPYYTFLSRMDRAANDDHVLAHPDDPSEGLQSATFVVLLSITDEPIFCLAVQPCVKHGNGKCFQRMGLLSLRRQRAVDVETWDRHSPGDWKAGDRHSPENWKAGDMGNTLFVDSLPSEVCRMTSLYVC